MRSLPAAPLRRRPTPGTRFAWATFVALLGVMMALPALAQPRRPGPPPPVDAYQEAIRRVAAMPSDQDLQSRARRLGLNVLNILWEDTGRSAGSSLGPNISDVTLQIQRSRAEGGPVLLPVIRYPNFTDRTGDIPLDNFMVRVGNERRNGHLRTVPLREVLEDLNRVLSTQIGGGPVNLLAERDSHVLVSAQHVFLPVPMQGQAEFVPVIFNYQSAPDNPAVLTLVVTREGMSVASIENRRDDQFGGYGQTLYYNAAGQRAPFTAERRSDVQARIEAGEARASDEGALDPGADVLLFIQIPLVHENRGFLGGLDGMVMPAPSAAVGSGAGAPRRARSEEVSNVESAVLGHGATQGPFQELRGRRIERDTRFPIRVTVQFYRATSNGVVNDDDLRAVYDQIQRVYDNADYVGSLVVPDGERHRPTDWIHTNPGGDTWRQPTDPWWFDGGRRRTP
jgi:hypothetical protein